MCVCARSSMKAELFCVHKHDTVRLHHLHIIHQNRDALLESVFNRTPWTARSVGSGMAHTEASQTAPHPWIHLASPVAAQTPVMQDPSTSASCAGLAHAPNFVTTAIVGGSALRHEPTTITVVLAPHAGRQEASIIRSISGLTGSSPEGREVMIFPASMKRKEELKMTVQDVNENMINQTPTPRRRVLVPLRAFVVQVASACLVGTATRQSPKAAPALALVAAAAVAPVPSVRADHYGHSSEDDPWSVTCGGCTFSGNYAGAPLARTGSCATDCTSLNLSYRAITSMPGDPFADMGALRTLRLRNNDLSSLETGVFDALTALRYVGEGESARVGSCGDA